MTTRKNHQPTRWNCTVEKALSSDRCGSRGRPQASRTMSAQTGTSGRCRSAGSTSPTRSSRTDRSRWEAWRSPPARPATGRRTIHSTCSRAGSCRPARRLRHRQRFAERGGRQQEDSEEDDGFHGAPNLASSWRARPSQLAANTLAQAHRGQRHRGALPPGHERVEQRTLPPGASARKSTHRRKPYLLPLVQRVVETHERRADRGGRRLHRGERARLHAAGRVSAVSAGQALASVSANCSRA
jgi:hypothetical protein